MARGSTNLAMAAPRLKMAICISCFHRCKNASATVSMLLRVAVDCAACHSVRVVAGCGLPSAVHTRGRDHIPADAT
eukprot:6596603-Karenia_brevis.AAC.1